MTRPKLLRKVYYFQELHRSWEFERIMRLLKANNDGGAMTEAMWLLYEEAYYEGRYSGLGYWRAYLKKIEEENK